MSQVLTCALTRHENMIAVFHSQTERYSCKSKEQKGTIANQKKKKVSSGIVQVCWAVPGLYLSFSVSVGGNAHV